MTTMCPPVYHDNGVVQSLLSLTLKRVFNEITSVLQIVY